MQPCGWRVQGDKEEEGLGCGIALHLLKQTQGIVCMGGIEGLEKETNQAGQKNCFVSGHHAGP